MHVILAVVLMALAGNASAAGTPEQKCEAGKKQAAAKYAACRAKADAKLVTSADSVSHGDALVKCQNNLFARLTKLEETAVEAGSACPTVADANDIDAWMAQCTDTVDSATASGGSFPSCGDNDVNQSGEQCDGSDLASATCMSLGFSGGALSCDGGCSFDTSACSVDCGDGDVDAFEDCDFEDLDGGSCATEGFTGGRLSCAAGCIYDTSDCWMTRFEDNGDGTITDQDTDLVWEKKVKLNSVQDFANDHDADNFYAWSGTCSIGGALCQPDADAETLCLAHVDGSPNGCSQCLSGICNVSFSGLTVWQWLGSLNDAGFGGSNAWRLPKRTELQAISDYADGTAPTIDAAFHGASCGAPCTDITNPACACTVSSSYNSLTSLATDGGSSYWVHFGTGSMNGGGKSGLHYVRAVHDMP